MKGKVLIVDDNKINILVAESYLIEAGLESCRALSGKEAVEIYVKEQPNLILMDLAMPGMDGFDTALKIMSLQEYQEHNTPIIAVSAHIGKSYMDKCWQIGFVEYIVKPMRYEETTEIIMKYLD